jgi:hypothetical protein
MQRFWRIKDYLVLFWEQAQKFHLKWELAEMPPLFSPVNQTIERSSVQS